MGITRNFWKVFWPSIALGAGIVANNVSSRLIQFYVPDRPIPQDLLFAITPYIGWTQFLSDPANILSVTLLAIYVFSGRIKLLPVVLASFAVAELLRSGIILLNPLGSPLGPDMRYGIANFVPVVQLGQFPSGHIMLVVLCYLLIDRRSAPSLKGLALFSVFLEIVALIFSRGHYGIDIIGGYFIAYLAFNEVKKRESKLLLELEDRG